MQVETPLSALAPFVFSSTRALPQPAAPSRRQRIGGGSGGGAARIFIMYAPSLQPFAPVTRPPAFMRRQHLKLCFDTIM